MMDSWSNNLGHKFHGGGESDSVFVVGDGVDVSDSDASLQFEALAQSCDGIDVGIEEFILLIRRQGTLGRDRGSGSGSKHLPGTLSQKSLAERVLTTAVAMVGNVQAEHEFFTFSSGATVAGTSCKGRGVQRGHDPAPANFPLFFHPLCIRRNERTEVPDRVERREYPGDVGGAF